MVRNSGRWDVLFEAPPVEVVDTALVPLVVVAFDAAVVVIVVVVAVVADGGKRRDLVRLREDIWAVARRRHVTLGFGAGEGSVSPATGGTRPSYRAAPNASEQALLTKVPRC